MDKKIELNTLENKFELFDKDKKIGEICFKLDGNIMIVDHTEVDLEYKGQGLAKRLLDSLVKYADENNYKIRPVCSFVVKAFEKYRNLHYLLEN